jgi:hypothetical protein
MRDALEEGLRTGVEADALEQRHRRQHAVTAERPRKGDAGVVVDPRREHVENEVAGKGEAEHDPRSYRRSQVDQARRNDHQRGERRDGDQAVTDAAVKVPRITDHETGNEVQVGDVRGDGECAERRPSGTWRLGPGHQGRERESAEAVKNR